jgi:hypothetical protein
MKNTILIIGILVFITLGNKAQQASLTIINKSNRQMTTKIMKGTEKKFTLLDSVSISPKKQKIIYLSETGKYFTKTQAILVDKDSTKNDTLYSKSNPFQVIADYKRGYSNITLKFTVKESKKPIVEGVIPITRKEYLEN